MARSCHGHAWARTGRWKIWNYRAPKISTDRSSNTYISLVYDSGFCHWFSAMGSQIWCSSNLNVLCWTLFDLCRLKLTYTVCFRALVLRMAATAVRTGSVARCGMWPMDCEIKSQFPADCPKTTMKLITNCFYQSDCPEVCCEPIYIYIYYVIVYL